MHKSSKVKETLGPQNQLSSSLSQDALLTKPNPKTNHRPADPQALSDIDQCVNTRSNLSAA